MNDSFSPKKSIRRTSRGLMRQFFDNYMPDAKVDWDAAPKAYENSAFFAYLGHAAHAEAEVALDEIHAVAVKAATGENLHSLLKQENISVDERLNLECDTVHSFAMWTYLNAPEKIWDRIAKFAYIDKIGDSLWFAADLEPGEDSLPDDGEPDLGPLKKALSDYIYPREGRGSNIEAEYYLRSANDECYVIHFDDYNRGKTEYRDGKFNHRAINYDSIEMVFVYHRNQHRIEARLINGDRRSKLELCDIWANTVKKRSVRGIADNKPVFALDHTISPSFSFSTGDDGAMISARMTEIGVSFRGCRGSHRVYKEEDGNIYEKMTSELSASALPMACSVVDHIVIKIVLADEYKRSKNQTLRIFRNSCNLQDKNPAVHGILQEAMKRWEIDHV